MHQSDIIDFLSHPESYGLPCDRVVKRLDTHISIVFLAGEYAYKLKRAIALPFVDFSSLKSRAYFCAQELEINRCFSPELYVDIVPVGFTQTFNLDGEGKVVDWLVKMKRFDQDTLFDRLCEENKLDEDTVMQLVDRVVLHYEQAEKNDQYGGLAGMERAFNGHYLALENCPAHVLNKSQIEMLKETVSQILFECASKLEERRKNGMVRHCHGDLHLRNICLFNGKATLFDAIEFEPDYAIIDVLYDLSFLLMDLIHRRRHDLASLVFNRYLGMTGDVAGLAVLGLFLSSRATIRAHVSAVASQNQKTQKATEFWEQEARTYLVEAQHFLVSEIPVLIAVGGLSGCGKSVLAKGLAPRVGRMPGAYIARTDMIRKRLSGLKPWQKLGEDGYSRAVTAKTYEKLYEEIETVLRSGYSVIVDGVFAREGERNKLENLARALKIPFHGIWLSAPLNVLEERVTLRQNDVSDADGAVVRSQSLYDIGRLDWSQVDASQDIETVLKKSLKVLDASLAKGSD